MCMWRGTCSDKHLWKQTHASRSRGSAHRDTQTHMWRHAEPDAPMPRHVRMETHAGTRHKEPHRWQECWLPLPSSLFTEAKATSSSSILSKARARRPLKVQGCQICMLPLSPREPSPTPRLPGSKRGLGSLGPISLRSFESRFSAVFPRANSHLFQHSDFIKLGILKACFVFQSELLGLLAGAASPSQSYPPFLGFPWHPTSPYSTWLRPPHHMNPEAIPCAYTQPTLQFQTLVHTELSCSGSPTSVLLQGDSCHPFTP